MPNKILTNTHLTKEEEDPLFYSNRVFRNSEKKNKTSKYVTWLNWVENHTTRETNRSGKIIDFLALSTSNSSSLYMCLRLVLVE